MTTDESMATVEALDLVEAEPAVQWPAEGQSTLDPCGAVIGDVFGKRVCVLGVGHGGDRHDDGARRWSTGVEPTVEAWPETQAFRQARAARELAARDVQMRTEDAAELVPETEPTVQRPTEDKSTVDPSRDDLREQFMRRVAQSIGLDWNEIDRGEAADVVDKAVMPLVDELLARAKSMAFAASLLGEGVERLERDRATLAWLHAEAVWRQAHPLGFTVTSDPIDVGVQVLALHTGAHLGYLKASDEWVDGTGEPLPDELQDEAHRLVRAGLLPEFAPFIGDAVQSAEGIVRVDQRTSNDCLRACVATLVGVPYEDAPDLTESPAWRTELRVWARARGYDFTFTVMSDPADAKTLMIPAVSTSRMIGIGPSPRGKHDHAVIVDSLTGIVHDPHLSRAGLPAGVTEVVTWCEPYEPAPVFRKGDPEPSTEGMVLIDKHGCRIERRGDRWFLAVDSAGRAIAADAQEDYGWADLGGAPFTEAPADPVAVWRPAIGARVLLVTDEAGEYPGTIKQSVADHMAAGARVSFEFGVKWDHLSDMGYYDAEDLVPFTAADAGPVVDGGAA